MLQGAHPRCLWAPPRHCCRAEARHPPTPCIPAPAGAGSDLWSHTADVLALPPGGPAGLVSNSQGLGTFLSSGRSRSPFFCRCNQRTPLPSSLPKLTNKFRRTTQILPARPARLLPFCPVFGGRAICQGGSGWQSRNASGVKHLMSNSHPSVGTSLSLCREQEVHSLSHGRCAASQAYSNRSEHQSPGGPSASGVPQVSQRPTFLRVRKLDRDTSPPDTLKPHARNSCLLSRTVAKLAPPFWH